MAKDVPHKLGHEHCGVCGACFLFPAQLHRCPATMSEEVKEIFDAEVLRIPALAGKAEGRDPLKAYSG